MSNLEFSSVYEELEWRGFVYQKTSEDLPKILNEEEVTTYIGFDPSARSLHVGSLVPLMLLLHMRRYGHKIIPLVGGGTGMIGDPSGKSKERPLLTLEEIREQADCLHKQMVGFLGQVDGGDIIEDNNAEWLCEIKLIEFLRDVGKHFSVNEMMRKDSVKIRFNEEESGISYTEFTYMLLQAYDFVELYRRHGCRMQCGASDQWGNIVSGVELIRRMEGAEVFGLTMPLLTKGDGKKFGKTETGTVWMDAEMTSPYAFYQFWMNAADEDTEHYLKTFTLLSKEEITDLVATIGSPERSAQRALAENVTKIVHGADQLELAQKATEALFSGNAAELPVATLKQIAGDVPSTTLSSSDVSNLMLFDLLVQCGAASSKSEARRHVEQGGVKLNGVPVEGKDDQSVEQSQFLEGEVLVIQRGKKNNYLVIVE